MEHVDRMHLVVTGQHLHDGHSLGVIALGQESFSDDLDALRKKHVPVPTYLRRLSDVLEGCWRSKDGLTVKKRKNLTFV